MTVHITYLPPTDNICNAMNVLRATSGGARATSGGARIYSLGAMPFDVRIKVQKVPRPKR